MTQVGDASPVAEQRTVPALENAIRRHGSGWERHLFGGKCRDCDTVTLGLKSICPGCWNRDSQDEHQLSTEGVLYSYTIVHHAPPGYQGPYAIAYVDLPENIRVMARIETELAERLTIGSTVTIEVAPVGVDEDGAIVAGPVVRENKPVRARL